MLFYSTIDDSTLELLKNIQGSSFFQDFQLVGGTSLALQIGHRISIDLDLFTSSKIDTSAIRNQLDQFGRIRVVNQLPSILNLFIDDVKVDFVSYRYDFINPPIIQDDLKLASIPDIAAMKLAAITGRGSRKDFIDLSFLLDIYTLPEIFSFYNKKFPDGSEFLVYKSLVYFEDAEIEPMPIMIKPVNWEDVKNKIIAEVKSNFP